MTRNNNTFSLSIKNKVAIVQYKEGLISIGKMAEFLSITKQEAMHMLNKLDIDWMNYEDTELDEQIKILDQLNLRKL